jgi:hypothetical protein
MPTGTKRRKLRKQKRTSNADGREGETVAAETLKTPGYWTATLNWDADIWDFSGVSSGNWPTLK